MLQLPGCDTFSGPPRNGHWLGTLRCVHGQDTLTVPLSTQAYKWVPVKLRLGVTLRWTGIASRGSRNTPTAVVASCYRDQDKLRPDGPLGSYADLFNFVSWGMFEMIICAFFQVMGSLAAEKPEHGKPLSGILIKRGFNYHLIAPDDLQSRFANISLKT